MRAALFYAGAVAIGYLITTAILENVVDSTNMSMERATCVIETRGKGPC